MENNKKQNDQREINITEFYLQTVYQYKNKMIPQDYLYISDKFLDISNRIDKIKKRK